MFYLHWSGAPHRPFPGLLGCWEAGRLLAGLQPAGGPVFALVTCCCFDPPALSQGRGGEEGEFQLSSSPYKVLGQLAVCSCCSLNRPSCGGGRVRRGDLLASHLTVNWPQAIWVLEAGDHLPLLRRATLARVPLLPEITMGEETFKKLPVVFNSRNRHRNS